MPDLPPDDDDPRRRFRRLRLQLSILRSEQKGERHDGTPLGGDLRGPHRSTGYEQLVTQALKYAWTWQGNALPSDA